MKNSEYKGLYDKYSKEKEPEVQQIEKQRQQKLNERNYDEMDNQSEISAITTQSNAQILGELQEMDVPIIGTSLTLNKGIQTDKDVRFNENQFYADEKSWQTELAQNNYAKGDDITLDITEEIKISNEHESFISNLSDEFDALTIADLKQMHKILLKVKNKNSSENLISQENNQQNLIDYDMNSLSKDELSKNDNELLLFSQNSGKFIF